MRDNVELFVKSVLKDTEFCGLEITEREVVEVDVLVFRWHARRVLSTFLLAEGWNVVQASLTTMDHPKWDRVHLVLKQAWCMT